jgi:hypothetical protein
MNSNIRFCSRKLSASSLLARGLAIAALAGLSAEAWAQNAVRGRMLYFTTNAAPLSCGTAGCHDGFPAIVKNNVNRGTTGAVIQAAINTNKGGMGFLVAHVNATDAADIAAYIANPAAGGGGAAITLSAMTLTFAGQAVGSTSAPQTITVSNTGAAPLTLSALTLGGVAMGDFTRAGTCTAGGSIAPNANCTIQVNFAPTAVGARSAMLTLTHNATGGSSVITLNGTGQAAPAMASLSPSTWSLVQTVNTASAERVVTLANTGGLPLMINTITMAGPNAAEFAIAAGGTCNAGTVVNGGANCTVRITFTPAAAGARTASLSIVHNASATPATVALSGTGTAAAQSGASLSADTLAFAAQSVGTASAVRTITLTNTGQAPLTLNTLALAGTSAAEFTRAGTCAAAGTVAVGATCTVQLAFAPAAVGARTATLTVTSNAANGNATLALNGTGVQASMTVNPMNASLSAEVGAVSDPLPATIANSGAGTLRVTDIAFNNPAFSFGTGAGACGARPFDLNSGQSCTLFVVFQPAAVGMVNGEVAIASNASATPTRVALSAQATESSGGLTNVGFGGCSVGTRDTLIDPMLALMLLIAVFVLWRRHTAKAPVP